MVSEYLDEARFGRETFVIRAEPTGMPRGVASLSMWMELVVQLRRVVTRDRTWTAVFDDDATIPSATSSTRS